MMQSSLHRCSRRAIHKVVMTACSNNHFNFGEGGGRPSSVFVRGMGSAKNKRKSKTSVTSGSRGARGHGWFIKYREGKGGRHLQGEYFDRDEVHFEANVWNQAVLAMGSQKMYLDVAFLPKTILQGEVSNEKEVNEKDDHIVVTEEDVEKLDSMENDDNTMSSTNNDIDDTTTNDNTMSSSTVKTFDAGIDIPTTTIHRLVIDIASEVMPETCRNFMGLCKDGAYKGSILYRMERAVGVCGGDILTNTGKTGQCWQSLDTTRTGPYRQWDVSLSKEPMPLWHKAGTVTMICDLVDHIDSRFLMCAYDAPHLDGRHRAFGILTPESLQMLQEWQESTVTIHGKPKNFIMTIMDCGLLDSEATDTQEQAA